MDLIQKMVEATEALVEAQTGFKKIDDSIGEVTQDRPNFTSGFAVRPTTLEQADGGVGFVFFNQGFEISLMDKLAYRGAARVKTFELYQQLEKLINKIYTIRVVGNNYRVDNINDVQAQTPEYDDNYVAITISFTAHYMRTGVF